MRKSFPIFILFLVPILLTVSCGRTDMIRIRIMAPVTEKKQDLSLLSDNLSTSPKVTLTDPKTSGASIYLMLGSIGFGSTSLNTTLEKETRSKSNDAQLLKETTSINARFNDLAFVIGEDTPLCGALEHSGEGVYKPSSIMAPPVVIVQQQMKHWKVIIWEEIQPLLCWDTMEAGLKPCLDIGPMKSKQK